MKNYNQKNGRSRAGHRYLVGIQGSWTFGTFSLRPAHGMRAGLFYPPPLCGKAREKEANLLDDALTGNRYRQLIDLRANAMRLALPV